MSSLTLSVINLDQLQHSVTARHRFERTGGTIGSEAATWLLTDREQSVAPIHCEIRWLEGSFCVIDHCNRTYLNDSSVSLGKRPARRLVEGDQLRVGNYRLLVQCAHADARLDALFTPDHSVLDQLLAETSAQAWQPSPAAPQAASEICSVFSCDTGKDPLAALDAVAVTRPSSENPLQRLIAGEGA
ncbi:FHA domain-containing protein [Pseudomonas sp. BCRC 81390]|uniref:FHA domain-containing protein n=1 Tax=Pseudomonas sp. BCRC 81390 TaxID=3054778 RepID=UPI002596F60A|nr:FHA domain-containing protein [Pseudomonas sp. BCRC 81390]MDM3886570.1 FHA domain-containing protein [Pseudomonas sp. BCRC 81390]